MTGLTTQEVEARIRAGRTNVNTDVPTRTVKQIVLSNTLTFFNFLNIVLFAMVILVGSFRNSLFIGTALINTCIGILQELRAKKILDKLAVITTSRARPIRDGEQLNIPLDELVIDDVILLKSGDQVPSDCVVIKGDLEVNESLLTGEADNLEKKRGDELFSGSVVTAGKALARVIHVGAENYSAKLTKEAKEFKIHNSELRNVINTILKVISVIIVPLGAAVFYKQFVVTGNTFRDAVVNSVASILGMIPEGLVLLISVALTVGTIRLAQKQVLVQELFCIETLSHVDVLCLDKTGTITSGDMSVEKVIPLTDHATVTVKDGTLQSPQLSVPDPKDMAEPVHPEVVEQQEEAGFESFEALPADIADALGNLMRVSADDNATAEALRDFTQERTNLQVEHVIPFSSDRKYSGASFRNRGTYLIGAVQFLFPHGNLEFTQKCQDYAADGYRVLVLAHSPQTIRGTQHPEGLSPMALILMTDVIRTAAPKTLKYFRSQGVSLKVISGDDPQTVAAIASKAGFKNAHRYIDATRIGSPEQMAQALKRYNVFGRVTPQQKKQMVQALQKDGHVVGMTGDGVNDVLALKEANVSIAMAAGSDAAKNIANVVLLENDFSTMPDILAQGRKVVNNIRRASSMFLIKTVFSMCLSLLLIFFGSAYPFEPIQMTLISACAVGIPTFILANFDPDYSPIPDGFLRHVLIKSVPIALTISACVFTIMMVCMNVYKDNTGLGTACVLVTGWSYMAALRTVYTPLNLFRNIVIYGMNVIFFVAAVLFQDLLGLRGLEFGLIVQVFILMAISPIIQDFLTQMFLRTQKWLDARKRAKEVKR